MLELFAALTITTTAPQTVVLPKTTIEHRGSGRREVRNKR